MVACELLRGARGRALEAVQRIVSAMAFIEPPSWRAAFLDAGTLLRRVFVDHEAIGLARLQNDVLLALTARHTGAVLVTRDRHFEALRRHLTFRCSILP